MSGVHNITVPYVDLDHFDWSFHRTGPLPWNQTVWSLLAVFTALPIWMTVELTVWAFYVFRKYNNLYFWSTLVCDWGTTIHAIGFVLKWCVPQCSWIISTVLAEIGWVSMVTGFSVVLYSRLRLVERFLPRNTGRWVLAMIIIDAHLLHIPTIVFQFLTSNAPTHNQFVWYMEPMERVQIMWFSIQEIVISALYIYATVQMLKHSIAFNPKVRNTFWVMIAVQIIVILADVLVITLDYCEYFQLKAVIHSFVYALKLQLEFVILNRFQKVIKKNNLSDQNPDNLQFNSFEFPSTSSPALASDKRWWSNFSFISSSPSKPGSGSEKAWTSHPSYDKDGSPVGASPKQLSVEAGQPTSAMWEQLPQLQPRHASGSVAIVRE